MLAWEKAGKRIKKAIKNCNKKKNKINTSEGKAYVFEKDTSDMDKTHVDLEEEESALDEISATSIYQPKRSAPYRKENRI